MKTFIITLLTGIMLSFGADTSRVLTLTPNPKMHCENCEKKIKGNLRFEKGVSAIETSISNQTVSITYNPSVTNPQTLQAAMQKIGYSTVIVSDKEAPSKKASGRHKSRKDSQVKAKRQAHRENTSSRR